MGAHGPSEKDRELAELKAQSARRREALEEARRVAERLGENLRVLEDEKERLVSDLAKAETESALRAERAAFLERALRARDQNVLALEGALESTARALKEIAGLQDDALAALRGSAKATTPPDASEGSEDDQLSVSSRALRELHRALGSAEAKLARAARLTGRLEEQASGASPDAAPAGGDLAAAEAISLPALASFERRTPSGGGSIGPRRPADAASLARPKPASYREGFLSQLSEIVRRHFERLFEPGRRWDGSDFGFLGAVVVALVAAFLVLSTPFRWMMRELRERELALLRRVVGALGGPAPAPPPGEASFPDVPAALEAACPPDETQAASLEEIEAAEGEAPAPAAARPEAPARTAPSFDLPPPRAAGDVEEFTATQALPDRAEIAERPGEASPPAAAEGEAATRTLPALEPEESAATQEISDAFDALAAGEAPGATQLLARAPAERHPTQRVPEIYEGAAKGPAAQGAAGEGKASKTQPMGYRDQGIVLHEAGRPSSGGEVDLHATQVIPDVLLREPAVPEPPKPPAPSHVPGTEAIEEVGVGAGRTAGAGTRPALAPEEKRGSPAGPRRNPKDALASDKDLLAEIEALIGRKLGPGER